MNSSWVKVSNVTAPIQKEWKLHWSTFISNVNTMETKFVLHQKVRQHSKTPDWNALQVERVTVPWLPLTGASREIRSEENPAHWGQKWSGDLGQLSNGSFSSCKNGKEFQPQNFISSPTIIKCWKKKRWCNQMVNTPDTLSWQMIQASNLKWEDN